MHLIITGRNMDVTPALKDYAQEKVNRIEKYLHKITSAHVILEVNKYRHIAEVTIQAHGVTLKGAEETGDMYSSIDNVMDKIEIQARKLKERLHDKIKNGQGLEEQDPVPALREEPAEKSAPGAARIVRSDRFNPKPMTVEEAAMQLEIGEERFLVFNEASSGNVNVLFRRGDGSFGLIETA